jgi:hypothetical protein
VQRVAPRLPLLLSNAFELMCLFCVPGTHDQKCTVVPFISTCYFARVVANTLCDVGFASRGLRFCVTHILEMGVPMRSSWYRCFNVRLLRYTPVSLMYVTERDETSRHDSQPLEMTRHDSQPDVALLMWQNLFR